MNGLFHKYSVHTCVILHNNNNNNNHTRPFSLKNSRDIIGTLRVYQLKIHNISCASCFVVNGGATAAVNDI